MTDPRDIAVFSVGGLLNETIQQRLRLVEVLVDRAEYPLSEKILNLCVTEMQAYMDSGKILSEGGRKTFLGEEGKS